MNTKKIILNSFLAFFSVPNASNAMVLITDADEDFVNIMTHDDNDYYYEKEIERRIQYKEDLNKPFEYDFEYRDIPALHEMIYKENIHLLKKLIKHNADINYRDGSRCTPLHIACGNGNVDIINLLIENKADINAKEFFTYTPLLLTTSFKPRNGQLTVKILLENGADPNITNFFNISPLLEICDSHPFFDSPHIEIEKNIAKLLIAHKADISIRGYYGSWGIVPYATAPELAHLYLHHEFADYIEKLAKDYKEIDDFIEKMEEEFKERNDKLSQSNTTASNNNVNQTQDSLEDLLFYNS